MSKNENDKTKPSVLSSEIIAEISNYHQVKLLDNDPENLPEAFRLYTTWASSLTRFYFYKAIDHQNILPIKPEPKTLYNADFVAKMITQIPMIDTDLKVLNQAMDEAKQIIAQLWRSEANIARLLITNFDIYSTHDQNEPIFKIHSHYTNSTRTLETLLSKVQNYNITEANITKTRKTIGVLAPLVSHTQTVLFDNAAIIDGQLYFEDTPEFQAHSPSDFKIRSHLAIPKTASPQANRVIDNFWKHNPEVHSEGKYASRPFIRQELLFAVWSTLAKHKVGGNTSMFGGFFMYEDNDGTGGGRGKSLITSAITRIVNSGIDQEGGTLAFGGTIKAQDITIPQVQIITAPRFINILSERSGGVYGDEEISFIKNMREEGNIAVGKYQTQAQNTTFKGNVFTTSNYVPKFKEHSDAIRDRFYGIEFTLKFQERGATTADHKYSQSDEFLGDLVRLAFQQGFHESTTFTKMTTHFKEGYDLLSRKNNNMLANIHEILEMRNDPRHEENFIIEDNIISVRQPYFKYQFAFNAGSVEGSSRHGIGKTTGEAQYKSWTAFVEYLQTNLDGETQRAIKFNTSKRVHKTRERFITIDTSLLPQLDISAKYTSIEEEWLIENGFMAPKPAVDELPDIDDLLPPSDNTTDTETETPEIVFPPEADFDLDSDPKEAFDENAQHIATPENIHIITENYQRDASQLVDMFADPIEDPQSNPREYADLIHDLCVITKRYSELTDQVPLYINITNIKFPHLKFKCGECIFEATPITPSKVRLSFRKNLE